MNTYVTKREGMEEVFGGMIAEEFEDVGLDADTELVYFDAREFDDEAAAERSAEGIPEFPEAQVENGPELELNGEISSVLQGVVEKFGGDPSDWHCTYTESSDQFFDGEKLIDQKGVSIEGLIPEDRLAQYQELIATWKDNSHEVQHLEWWEKTDEGETIHVTALSLAENGEVLSETWSHTIESGKEFEQFDEEVGVVLENNPGSITETVLGAIPEKLDLPHTEDFDLDPQILDLTAYLQESLSAEETSYDAAPFFNTLALPAQTEDSPPSVEPLEILATPTTPRPEVNLVEEPVIAKISENEPITATTPSSLQRKVATEKQPAEVIAPVVDITLDSNPANVTKTHETVLESKAYATEMFEPVQGPEVAMPTAPTATEVSNPDVVVFDNGSESHSGNSSEDVAILDVPLEISTKERERPEQAPLEAPPPRATEKSISSEYILDVPKTTDAKDGMREIVLRVDEVAPEKISLSREIVSANELVRKDSQSTDKVHEAKSHQEPEMVKLHSEGAPVLEASLGASTGERGEPDTVTTSNLESIRGPLEVVPSKAAEGSIANNPISTTPKAAEVKDGMREIALRADEVTPEKIALPRESVFQPITIDRSLEGVRNARVFIEKPAEITAAAVEFIPEISAPDMTTSAQKLDSEVQVQKTETQKEELVKDTLEVSLEFVDKVREIKLQDPEIAVTHLTDTAPNTREDELKLVLSYDDAGESPAESKRAESAPLVAPDRREILLRSFGLTSEEIRRYQDERQGNLRLAGTRGANNAPAKVSRITLAGDRHNGISLLRYAA